jgi:tetratricopeptide (TPR) repeat protein
VAYGSLPQERQHALHARIVEALERLYPDWLADQVERLAHHAIHGEVWDKAVTYFWQAWTKAFLHSANREAAACYERALTALQHLPESRQTHEQAIDLRLHLGNALVPLGEFRCILDRLHEAKPLAEALADQRRLGRVLSFQAFGVWMTGDHEHAVALGQRALDLAHCYLGLGRLYNRVERWERARSELSTAMHLFRAMDIPVCWRRPKPNWRGRNAAPWPSSVAQS